MAGSRTSKFQSGSLSKTIDVHLPDFQEDIQYDDTTYNVTSGLSEGIGPRYGNAPLPGQLDNEAVASGQNPNFRVAETQWEASYYNRQYAYGIWPLIFGGADSATALATRSTYYAVVAGALYTNVSPHLFLLDVVLLSTLNGSVNQQSTNFASGLGQPGLFASQTQVLREMIQASNSSNTLRSYLTIPTAVPYFSSTSFSINNPNVPANWLIGNTSYGTANGVTTAPSLELTQTINFSDSATSRNIGGFSGLTSDIVAGTFLQGNHTATVYALTVTANDNIDYNLTFLASTTIFVPVFTIAPQGYPEIDLSTVTATQTTGGTSYGSTVAALYNDNQTFINASYQGVLVAAGKAMCMLFQDWQRSIYGSMTQYVDLVNNPLYPQAVQSSGYGENGTPINTSLAWFPSYTANTALTAAGPVKLNGANTGLLRANTIYQICFSVFNKRLNFETNVGTPVTFLVDGNDFNSVQVWDNTAIGGAQTQAAWLMQSGYSLIPWPGTGSGLISAQTNNSFSINHLEYRWYYRQVGLQEWLPALFMDAAQWWFYPYHQNLSLCTGGIGGLPGGRAGGYQDYSALPADQYNCVVMFKNRAFWFSDKALCFSRQNNIFSYPSGNTAACPAGAFKGAIVATYYGQAQQQARLVVFTTQGTYIGLFTGNPTNIPVQVSPTTIGSYPLDGSDFELNAWTSISAFSYRAAANCEGVLYFWGPHGIFIDDGVDPVTPISRPLEPDIFNYYDSSQTDAIHAVYNNNTKEVIWFYPPKVPDASFPTYALVYNRLRQSWLFTKYPGQVDASQSVNIKTSSLPTAGPRTVVYSRQSASTSIQRPYFYDERDLAGDIFPTKELLVKAVATPSAGLRQLTLAAGYDTGALSSINVGDVLTLQQTSQYATSLATPSDFTAVITAINTGSGLITVKLPTGATLDASWTAASNALFFPVYHAAAAYNTAQNTTLITGPGINGFTYQISTKYWIPSGITFWGLWLWYHLLFKLRLLLPSSAANNVTFAHRTPVSDVGYVSKTLTISNNSDSNFQALVQLILGNQNLEGQGIRIKVSGVQTGGSWVLQSINGQTAPLDGEQLKIFEE